MADRDVTFGPTLLGLFAAASHDRNPLHTSEEFARATPYGEPIVFGVLAALAVLRWMPGRDAPVRRIDLTFIRPVFAGRAYTVSAAATAAGGRGQLADGDQPLVSVVVRYGAPSAPGQQRPAGSYPPPRRQPADRSLDQLPVGSFAAGRYRASKLRELAARLGLGDGALTLTDGHLAALLWGSYLTGMELPGRQALFARFTLDFAAACPLPLSSYRAEVRRADPRFSLIRVAAALWTGVTPVASAQIEAFVRPRLLPVEPALVRAALPDMPRVTGRTAVVIGASRGLGAALALALAVQGYEVIGCYQVSQGMAGEVAAGGPVMVCGDAADPAFCEGLARQVAARGGRLHLLVCCASPPLRPLRLSTGSAAQEVADYVAASLRLAATPIGALVDLLEAARGQVVVISSQALANPPPQWPHYVAAKGALEYLVGALTPARPLVQFRVLRAPRMNTGYAEDLLAEQQAASPVAVAADLVRELMAQDAEAARESR
jgi:NAD(P)-dependent dehydrogenase (short-subunit alcohol dehydrogenase family)